MKRGLSLLAAGIMAAGLTGCEYHPEYGFEGTIDSKNVKFEQRARRGDYPESILSVSDSNGVESVYFSYTGKPLQLHTLHIIENGSTNTYTARDPRPFVSPMMDRAQEKFDWYLEKIVSENTLKTIKDFEKAGIEVFERNSYDL